MKVGIEDTFPAELLRTIESNNKDRDQSISRSSFSPGFTHRRVSLHIQSISTIKKFQLELPSNALQNKQSTVSPISSLRNIQEQTPPRRGIQPDIYSNPDTCVRKPSFVNLSNDVESADHEIPVGHQLPISSGISDLFTSTRNNRGLHNVFLGFTTKEFQTAVVAKEYRQFKRSGFNIPLTMIVIILIAAYFGANLGINLVYGKNPFYLTGFISAIIALFCVLFATFNRAVILSYDHNIIFLQRHFEAIAELTNSPYSQFIEDFALIFIASATSFYMLGGIISGRCDQKALNLNSVDCDPRSNMTSIPAEQILSVFLGILLGQVLIKGTSRFALCSSWVISLIITNVCLWLLDSEKAYSLNLCFVFIIILSYEFERNSISLFLEKKVMLNTETQRVAADILAVEMRLER